MLELKEDPSLDGTLSIQVDTPETDQIKDQIGETNHASSNHYDTKNAVQPGPQWDSDAPDGGLIAWGVILGLWCTSFCSFGWLSSVGVFQEYYENSLLRGYSASTISWIPSLQFFLMMGMGPIVGALYDNYGPRWLLMGGSFLHVFGIMMTSLGIEYYQILLAQGVCSALGVSAIFQPSVNCAGPWFNRKRGAALGIAFTGSSIGGVVFPIMVSGLIPQVGFGWTMRICAFLILFLLIIANLTMRPYYTPRPHKVTGAELMKPLTEVPFLLLLIGFCIFSFGFYIPLNYLPLQALSAGMSSDLAQYLIPILNAGSLFGRLLSGFLGDKLGRYNTFIVVCNLTGIWILALWIPHNTNATLIAFAALFGFFSGAYASLITPMIMQISPLAETGFRTGIVFFVASIAGLSTNPINGAILAHSGWVGPKIFAGIFCLVGTAFVLVARFKQTGFKLFVQF
ncbi:MFS general substrate transporter [Lojkania enalia]|uniref:MFS general substrate transporter n=1 Tax=Lojkania enalia TaxID=147567 RepID=A0A9P4N2N1_9PLEO|nr:MFS general substrate transporter [Didymosphaeria enalia]